MKREIILTEDGSSTVFLPEWKEYYHSTHGAINESTHIFIEAGLKYLQSGQKDIRILEVGFGTGLNAFLTAINAGGYTIYYIGLEPYPLNQAEIGLLNYDKLSGYDIHSGLFNKIHQCAWEKACQVNENFILMKLLQKVEDAHLPEATIDLVYFDAFAPMVQPELWLRHIFEKIHHGLKAGGCLVTYSCKGDVKRALKNSGFSISKLPGPAGKREFLRAIKTI